MLDKVRIRDVSEDDAPELKRINSAITSEVEDVDFRQIIREKIRKNDEDIGIVAELDGKVVGYMISYVLHGGFGLERSAWIATFGVDPKHMGQGIGKKMAEEIFSIYRRMNIQYIYTSVQWDSVDLLSFFKKMGFDRSAFINLKHDLSKD
jgi:ribosomal protein S18 acetylase RimI-like enzyme